MYYALFSAVPVSIGAYLVAYVEVRFLMSVASEIFNNRSVYKCDDIFFSP